MAGTEFALAIDDPSSARKARGAFFTPPAISRYMCEWAIRSATDRVLEPSAGDAAFLLEAVRRLQRLGVDSPEVWGSELHGPSARLARQRVSDAGGTPYVAMEDFFDRPADDSFDAVVGNPPYVRYQDFAGAARLRSQVVAQRAGVVLSGLASSWAAFTVHAARSLKRGGRLAFVLPAELLTVNYAAPIREFLLNEFGHVEIVVFAEQVFVDVEADVVLLLASDFGSSSETISLRPVRNTAELPLPAAARTWRPADRSGKWNGALEDDVAQFELSGLQNRGTFVQLSAWGRTSLGAVTGANHFFGLSPRRARELGIPRRDLVRISPPGSSHLRGLSLSDADLRHLGRTGASTWLFRPSSRPSAESLAYIEIGRATGVDQAYKCRVRRDWYRVPLGMPADLLLTYMNADTVRLTTNEAGAHHLNSVHGVLLKPTLRELGRSLLPLASLNSATVLSAELSGRSYGGGILKIEPREAGKWLLPSPEVVQQLAGELYEVRDQVLSMLNRRDLLGAISLIDPIVLGNAANLREAHIAARLRRTVRGHSG